ncbi:O-Glycosyl hydrolase [Micromonospora sediminicola]|uniref:O-Glycosyl hydrolase n=1 Tax=Micromonospora sediminicola TaxID=946078 RepID=A0A1A9B9L1_9ACTN|nr:glycoside hydrolase family 30 beta sandwich domain-containing protein [Micromonospora sediminicola]SBT65761.1 O-Glycosyl hydrolase [Micromonospora sediminicola]
MGRFLRRAVLGVPILLTVLLTGVPARAADPVATLEWNDVRQNVEGFGAASNFFVRYLDALTPGQQNQVFDALFDGSAGAGMTIVRHEPWGGGCDGDEAVRCPADRVGTKPNPLSHSMRAGEFELNCPNTPDPSGRCQPGRLRDHYQVWFHQQMAQRQPGALPWLNYHNAPEYMKAVPYDNSPVRQDQYQAFANYLSRTVQAYRSQLGVPVAILSMANEPPLSYADKTVWSHADLNRFTRDYMVPTLARDGVDVDLMLAEDVSFSDVNDAIYNDPATMAAMDIHATHAYSGGADGGWQTQPLNNCQSAPLPRAKSAGKRIWMSECTPGPTTTQQGVRNARRIHEFFTGTQGNAWVWWRYVTGDDNATLPDARGGLVTINDKTGAYEIGKTVWTTAQFSRFVRPGWKRIDTTPQPTTGVYVSSYKDPTTGRFATVVVNENTTAANVDLKLSGVSTTSLQPYRTSATENVAWRPAVAVTGGTAMLNLPGQSVTTYLGSGSYSTATEDVVDNASPLFSKTGTWTASTGASGYWGTGYWHDGTTGADTGKTATWTSPITTTGRYEVYLRYTSAPDRPDAAPVEINYAGGVTTGLTVNQRTGGGTWKLLGTWPFAPGSGDHVKISAADAGYTVADAVRFVKVG